MDRTGRYGHVAAALGVVCLVLTLPGIAVASTDLLDEPVPPVLDPAQTTEQVKDTVNSVIDDADALTGGAVKAVTDTVDDVTSTVVDPGGSTADPPTGTVREPRETGVAPSAGTAATPAREATIPGRRKAVGNTAAADGDAGAIPRPRAPVPAPLTSDPPASERGVAGAVADASRAFRFPLLLAAAVLLFLAVQQRMDARDPKLADVPEDEELMFA